MPSQTDLSLFIAIAQHRSIAGAARSQKLTRATAARRLAALEDTLGVQLVHRNTRTLSLTQAGEVFLSHATPILKSIKEAQHAVRQLDGQPRGVLRLAVPSVSVERILHPLLFQFAQQHPELSLEIVCEADVSKMVEDGFDIGLQFGLEENVSLIMRTLLRTRVFLIASPHYLETSGPIEHPDQLSEHKCLVRRRPNGSYDPWPLLNGGWVTVPAPYVLSNSVDLLHHMARSGMGVAMTAVTLSGPQIKRGELVPVLLDHVGQEMVFAMVFPATKHVPPKVRTFITFAQEWVGRNTPSKEEFDLNMSKGA